MDPTVAVEKIETVEGLIDEQLWAERTWSLLLGAFAGLALLLAAVGIFGVMSYSVTQRTREIGVRAAIGADRGQVLRLVLLEGGRLVAIGAVLGLLALPLLRPLVQDLLFGVGAADPLAVGSGAALLLLVALSACLIPAWRAASIDPLVALRDE